MDKATGVPNSLGLQDPIHVYSSSGWIENLISGTGFYKYRTLLDNFILERSREIDNRKEVILNIVPTDRPLYSETKARNRFRHKHLPRIGFLNDYTTF